MSLKGGYRPFCNLPITYESQKSNFKISKSGWSKKVARLMFQVFFILQKKNLTQKNTKNWQKVANQWLANLQNGR